MKLPWRRQKVSRGQALVEFAMVLPVLALLLVMAIDFGRVFYGWVALNNAARVGANFAALHADAWTAPDKPQKQAERAEYMSQIINDAAAINCTPAPSTTNIAPPTFTAQDGVTPITGVPPLGSQAMVQLSCTMPLITPLASNILGGGVNMDAQSVFAVRSGAISGVPVGATVPTPTATPTATATPSATATSTASPTPTSTPCPLPIANFDANKTKGKDPLMVKFTDTSQTFGCTVSGWTWDFGDGQSSTLQNPMHQFVGVGTYTVTLTVTSPGGTDSQLLNGYITVE